MIGFSRKNWGFVVGFKVHIKGSLFVKFVTIIGGCTQFVCFFVTGARSDKFSVLFHHGVFSWVKEATEVMSMDMKCGMIKLIG